MNRSGLQVLRELRAETAVAYPERRNNQIAPEQVRQTQRFILHEASSNGAVWLGVNIYKCKPFQVQ